MDKTGELYNKAKDILEKYNQEQLLLKYYELSDEKKEILVNQILHIDFELMNKLYKTVVLSEIKTDKEEKIEPIDYTDKNKLTEDEKEYYRNLGAKEIKAGKMCAVTMAGRTRDKTSDTMDQKEHLC